MAFRFPIRAPNIEANIESTHPLQITIQSEPFQNVGIITATIMLNILHNKGTYKILLGLFLHIKKQHTTMISTEIMVIRISLPFHSGILKTALKIPYTAYGAAYAKK